MATVSELLPELEPLAFLLGTWRGEGEGHYPTITSFGYGQEMTFGYYGKPVLEYTSRAWALDDGRPLARESGFWGRVEVLLAHPTGIAAVLLGAVSGRSVELASETLALTPSAKHVDAESRRYEVTGDELAYAEQMAAVGQPLQPHVSARLHRVGG